MMMFIIITILTISKSLAIVFTGDDTGSENSHKGDIQEVGNWVDRFHWDPKCFVYVLGSTLKCTGSASVRGCVTWFAVRMCSYWMVV